MTFSFLDQYLNSFMTSFLWLKTWSDGYIAIILPYRGKHESVKDSLLSLDQYKELLLSDVKSG